MADLTVASAGVAPVFPIESTVRSFIASAAITAGQVISLTTAGKAQVADANAVGKAEGKLYLALNAAGTGQAVDGLELGEVYGIGVSGLNVGAKVYLSDTAGALSDTPGNILRELGTVAAISDSANTKILKFQPDMPGARRVAIKTIAGADLDAASLNWQNTHSGAVEIVRAVLDVTTAATGACTVDIGTTATSATTSSDNLIDGKDVNAAAGSFDNVDDKGTNGKATQRLASGKWVTINEASGSAAGLAAKLILEYILLD